MRTYVRGDTCRSGRGGGERAKHALALLTAGGGELLDAEEQAMAIAAAPNTRRAYTTAYRAVAAFAAFLRPCYGEASP